MVDAKVLDNLLQETIDTIRKSQEEMFNIAESARLECERVKHELDLVQEQAMSMIDQVDAQEQKDRRARKRLMEVSRNFAKFTEDDIKDAYGKAKDIQIELVLLRERERQLKEKRSDLEVRFRNLRMTVSRAENLVSQVGVAMDFLSRNLKNIWEEVEKVQAREETIFAIIRAQEEERMRIARDIHDGPAQSLANVVMQIDYCQKLLQIRPEEVTSELDVLKSIARKNLEGIRKIIFALRPMDLDDLGLVPAVKRFLTEFEKSNDTQVEFKFFGREQRYLPTLEVAVFRIIQEAINNVSKHARASTVKVILETRPAMIHAVVRDDGVGFRPDEGSKEGSFGLRGMQERTALLNGELKISSTPGRGTEIIIKIPVQEDRLYGIN